MGVAVLGRLTGLRLLGRRPGVGLLLGLGLDGVQLPVGELPDVLAQALRRDLLGEGALVCHKVSDLAPEPPFFNRLFHNVSDCVLKPFPLFPQVEPNQQVGRSCKILGAMVAGRSAVSPPLSTGQK